MLDQSALRQTSAWFSASRFPGGVCWTVTGFGLEPGTLVTLNFDLGGGAGNSTGLVGADGTISPGVPEFAVSCSPGLEEHYSTSATGTTSGGATITTPTLTGVIPLC